ncbi:hypothetical protein MAPG_00146 [Magnaporthiopsis poae ATCC 64411]|uniref:Cyanovirin-N domain-containing protein n=1 Tax=Magnaporthiopsis poae (strain ATCC 64411 / 73-15) TaxID=644358 RepID=A0A0C4DK83_MAGP6|nr:hypothetical protein MAPG_00146 [Magnaporthiopsis poae ATCC 64411]
MRASITAALSLFLSVQSVAASAQLFSLTCSDLAIDGTVLKAQCKTNDKSAVPASIDLEKIIEAKDGKLSWKQDGAGYASACSSCTLYRDFNPRETKYWGHPFLLRQAMKCSCSGAEASIILDQEIGNDNGKLYVHLW